MKQKHAVIIGGGLGGLALALRLAARPDAWRVTICEHGDTLGGKMNRLERDGHTFDTGPSLITMPWIFQELFRDAGARLEDHVELVKLDPLAHYVWPDGATLTYTTDLGQMTAAIRTFEPRDVEGFFRLLKLGAKLYALSAATFFRRPPEAPPDMEVLKALRHLPLRWGWGNYARTVAAHLRSPYLRQLYNRYPTYVGSSPYALPATLLVIPYIEFAFGGWFVRGGLYRIVTALETLARERGVELLLGARVERVLRDGRRATGVRLAGGQKLDADVVVMNGDAGLLPVLLGEAESPPSPADRSMSGLVFLLGLKRRLDGHQHHTVYFSSSYEREFDELFGQRRFPTDPTVYVNIPSRTDPTTAPPDGESLFIMANAPANDAPAWERSVLDDARRAVFGRLAASGFPALDGDVTVEDVWTPTRMAQRYLMPGGSIYGRHSHGWRNAFFRPGNRVRGVRGLYRVGGSSHPGGGTPTVLLSAKITRDTIAQDEGQ